MTDFEIQVATELAKLPGMDRRQRLDRPLPYSVPIRMTRALHERLKDQAHELKVSLNGLCVALLAAGSQTLEECRTADPESSQEHAA